MTLEDELERRFPDVDWRKPLPVAVTDSKASTEFACRFCIAKYGMKATDVGKQPKTREEFDAHMKQEHGKKKMP
jgi:hypothetical protein